MGCVKNAQGTVTFSGKLRRRCRASCQGPPELGEINAGWWLSHPSEKCDSLLGSLFTIYGEKKNMFQTTNQNGIHVIFHHLGDDELIEHQICTPKPSTLHENKIIMLPMK